MNRKCVLLTGACIVGCAGAMLFFWRPGPSERPPELPAPKPLFDADAGERDERPIGADEKDWKTVAAADLGIHEIEPMKDEDTGFVVGGKNATALIAKLTHINRYSISDLEFRMRPRRLWSEQELDEDWRGFQYDPSSAGFLGVGEKLLRVLEQDNRLVVDELGLSHQLLARELQFLCAVGAKVGAFGAPKDFVYQARRFRISICQTRGHQLSPFLDDTRSGADAILHNLTAGKKIEFGLLVPDMIERYGFYEGRGTRYRLEPSNVLAVLDYLQERIKK